MLAAKDCYLLQFTDKSKFEDMFFAVIINRDTEEKRFHPMKMEEFGPESEKTLVLFSDIDDILDFKKNNEISDEEGKVVRLDSIKLTVGQKIIIF